MKKLTLKFSTLEELALFARLLQGGYVLNTITLTITAKISKKYINQAVDQYGAELMEKNEGSKPNQVINPYSLYNSAGSSICL